MYRNGKRCYIWRHVAKNKLKIFELHFIIKKPFFYALSFSGKVSLSAKLYYVKMLTQLHFPYTLVFYNIQLFKSILSIT